MKKILFTLALTLTTAFAAPRSEAATISFSQQVTATDTRGSVVNGSFDIGYDLTFDVSLPRFDPALGTLTAVQVASRAINNPSQVVTVTNTGSDDIQGSSGGRGGDGFTFPGGLADSDGGGGGGPFSLAAGESTTLDFGAVPNIDRVYTPRFVPFFDITPYIGLGNFTGTVGASNRVSITPSGSGSADDLAGTLNATATAEFTVTYTFVPIPEPTSLALLGLGGLLVCRRRTARG